MKLTKEMKKKKALELADILQGSAHLIFTQYQGMKFQEMDALRLSLVPSGCKYKVIKNSVLTHALKEAGIQVGDESVLSGPGALLFGSGDDPVTPARLLVKARKGVEALKITGGVVGGKWLTEAEITQLSTLGTKPEVLSQLAGVLYSSVSQSASVLAAPIRDLVLVLKAVEGKKTSESA